MPSPLGTILVEIAVLASVCPPGVPVSLVEADRPDAQHLLDVDLVPDLALKGRVIGDGGIHQAAELHEVGKIIRAVLGPQAEEPAVVLLIGSIPLPAFTRRRIADVAIAASRPVPTVIDHEAVIHLDEVAIGLVEPQPDILGVRHPDMLAGRRDPGVDLPAGHRLHLRIGHRDRSLVQAQQVMGDPLPGVARVVVMVLQVELPDPPVDRLVPGRDHPEAAVPAAAGPGTPREAHPRLVVDRRAAEAEGAVDQVVGEPLAAAKTRFVVGARVEAVIVEAGGRVPRRLLRVDEIAPVVNACRRWIQHHGMGTLGDINREAAGVARGIRRLDEEDDPRVDALRRNHGLPGAPSHLRHLHRRGIGRRVVHRPAQAKTLDPVGVGRADLDPDLLTSDRDLGSLHEVGHHRAQVDGAAGLQSPGDAVEAPGTAEVFGHGELVGLRHLVLVAVGVDRLGSDMPFRIEDNKLVLLRTERPHTAIGALNPVNLIVAASGGDDLQGAGPVDRVSGAAPAAHMGSLDGPAAGV